MMSTPPPIEVQAIPTEIHETTKFISPSSEPVRKVSPMACRVHEERKKKNPESRAERRKKFK